MERAQIVAEKAAEKEAKKTATEAAKKAKPIKKKAVKKPIAKAKVVRKKKEPLKAVVKEAEEVEGEAPILVTSRGRQTQLLIRYRK